MLLSGRTPAISILLGNAGARRDIFTDWGICGRSTEYKVQSEHARTASSLFALTSFQPTPPTPGANSRRLAPSTFNPSLEDCPGALNSRLP
jgi:hypothetical protein